MSSVFKDKLNQIETEPIRKESEYSELVTVRIPSTLLGVVRIVAQSTDHNMSQLIRDGIALRVDELNSDPVVQNKIQQRIDELKETYSVFETV